MINLLSYSYSRLHLISSKNELLQDKISADVNELGHVSTVTQAAGVVRFPGTTRAALEGWGGI